MITPSALEIVSDLQRLDLLPQDFRVKETDDPSIIEIKLLPVSKMKSIVHSLHDIDVVTEPLWESLSKSTQVWATKSIDEFETAARENRDPTPFSLLGFDIYKIALDLSYVEMDDVITVTLKKKNTKVTGVVVGIDVAPETATADHYLAIETEKGAVLSFSAADIENVCFVSTDDFSPAVEVVAVDEVEEVKPQSVTSEKPKAASKAAPAPKVEKVSTAPLKEKPSLVAKVAKAAPKGKIVSSPKGKVSDKPKKVSANRTIKEYVCANTQCTIEEVRQHCKEVGVDFSENTLTVLYFDVRQTIAIYESMRK